VRYIGHTHLLDLYSVRLNDYLHLYVILAIFQQFSVWPESVKIGATLVQASRHFEPIFNSCSPVKGLIRVGKFQTENCWQSSDHLDNINNPELTSCLCKRSIYDAIALKVYHLFLSFIGGVLDILKLGSRITKIG
jgi:hypothetical protein